jgi:predicted nucleotidyltransferase
MKSEKLIAYAMDYVSFLIENIEQSLLKGIKSIVLFGSVARKEATENSDIDLFIELFNEKNAEKIDQKTLDLLDKFLNSSKVKKYWELMGINLPFSLKIGTEDTWKSLIPSLLEDGITIFQKYVPEKLTGKHYTLFTWENIKPAYNRTFLYKKIFGYTQNEVHYPGLLDNFSGKKIGKGSILVPIEHQKNFMELFKKHGVTVKVFDVVE